MLNPIQAARALWKFGQVVRDPDRLEDVITFVDTIAKPDLLAPLLNRLREEPVYAEAFRRKVRLQPLDVEALAALPAGTLGQVFANHLKANGLDPDALPRRSSEDDVSYFRAALYETHDIWHAVTGFETDVAGELGLQAFYAAQIHGKVPLGILSMGLLNTLFYVDDREQDRRLSAIARGWAMGERAVPLFGVEWDALWGRPLGEVRAQLGVDALALPIEPRAHVA